MDSSHPMTAYGTAIWLMVVGCDVKAECGLLEML